MSKMREAFEKWCNSDMTDLEQIARSAMDFMGKATYLDHPDVPYLGTVNGDSPEAWTKRVWVELMRRVFAELTKGQEPVAWKMKD